MIKIKSSLNDNHEAAIKRNIGDIKENETRRTPK